MHDPHDPTNTSAETTYWGVPCRTCNELVLFDVYPCHTFGIGTATRRPGAVRCANRHNHIYFPHDYRFFPSEASVDEATMEQNRLQYVLINPPYRSPHSEECRPARSLVY